jgi:iron uptake system component EfeO
MTSLRLALPTLAVVLAPGLAACTDNADTGSGDASHTIVVESSNDACELSATEAPSGSLRFEVTNAGDQVTEFYLYADDGESVVGEVEDIGPGLTRDLVVTAPPGDYLATCKPGMAGDGIRIDLTVTDSQ